jgi:hypothetical protein
LGLTANTEQQSRSSRRRLKINPKSNKQTRTRIRWSAVRIASSKCESFRRLQAFG